MKNILYLLILAFFVSAFPVAAQDSEKSQDDQGRLWSDKTGQFKVKAKLLSNADGKVKLLKEDGLVITVPIERLSEADQKFLSASDDPFAGGTPLEKDSAKNPTAGAGKMESAKSGGTASLSPDAKVAELPSSGKELFVDIKDEAGSLSADPLPYQFKPVEFVRPLETIDAYARMSSPFLADPAEPSFLVSVHRVGNTVSKEHFGRIYLINKSNTQPKVVLDIEQDRSVARPSCSIWSDACALGVNSPSERGGDLVLFDKLASGSPKVIARWHSPNWDKRGFNRNTNLQNCWTTSARSCSSTTRFMSGIWYMQNNIQDQTKIQ